MTRRKMFELEETSKLGVPVRRLMWETYEHTSAINKRRTATKEEIIALDMILEQIEKTKANLMTKVADK